MKIPLAITAPSLIRSVEEEKVVLATITELSKLNIPLIITDGGSSDEQKKKIKEIPNIIFFEEKGLFNQLKKSMNEGAKIANALFYLHSDKLDFARHYVKKMIDFYMTLPKKSMLIPSRTSSAFETYPSFQKMTEVILNSITSEFMEKKEDYYYGPKIFSSLLVPYFGKVKGEIGWGYEAFMYILNKRLNYPFYFYPVDQITSPKDVGDKEAIKTYRLRNLQWQIEGFIQGKEVKLQVKL